MKKTILILCITIGIIFLFYITGFCSVEGLDKLDAAGNTQLPPPKKKFTT